MGRVVVAEYDASENALRLAAPLPGVRDHEKVRVSIEREETPVRSTELVDPLARLASLDAPTGDIEQVISEIETGRR